MKEVGDGWEKMEGYCSTGQSPQQRREIEEEEGEEEEVKSGASCSFFHHLYNLVLLYRISPSELLNTYKYTFNETVILLYTLGLYTYLSYITTSCLCNTFWDPKNVY